MRRSAFSVLAALVLVPLLGGGVALAAPPAQPQIAGINVIWDMRTWDDGISRCTVMADAALDPAFTKGAPVSALAYFHHKWVGEGSDDTFYWTALAWAKPSRGATNIHVYTAFDTWGDGYWIVDAIRMDLLGVRGNVLSSLEVPTMNTCANGPAS